MLVPAQKASFVKKRQGKMLVCYYVSRLLKKKDFDPGWVKQEKVTERIISRKEDREGEMN